ncbi:phosphoribosyltransferase [Candidatus Bathyarchaeota archaeon]|nr:phosphoribosyltransferase [Candidatus Bathyarchaeota archaeon]
MKDLNEESPVFTSVKNLELESLSWNNMYTLLLQLADDIRKSNFIPDIIVGISRGGWIPARILSDLLEISKLANITVEFYVGIAETKHEPAITQSVSLPVKNKKILIVDDLADTGQSLRLATLHLKDQGASEIRIATLFYKPWSVLIPHYYKKETSKWVVFPWELKETIKRLMAKGKSLAELKGILISSGKTMDFVEQLIKEIVSDQD